MDRVCGEPITGNGFWKMKSRILDGAVGGTQVHAYWRGMATNLGRKRVANLVEVDRGTPVADLATGE